MTQQLSESQIHACAFDSIEDADRAIRGLLAAGFSKDELLVICPTKFLDHFRSTLPQAESPDDPPEGSIMAGAFVGATLGGVALAATVLTGGAAALTGVVLIGGGALAGAIANLIVEKGYEHEIDPYSQVALEQGRIVVGFNCGDEECSTRVGNVAGILESAGGKPVRPE